MRKRDGNIMLFGSWFGNKYDDNPKWLFEYILAHRPDIHAYWITPDPEIFKELDNKGIPCHISSSEQARALAKKAKYIVTCTTYADIGGNLVKYLGGACLINQWHGVPLKKIMYDDKYWQLNGIPFRRRINRAVSRFPLRKNYVISTGPVIGEIYQSAFRTDRKHVLELGQVRNDYFFTIHQNPYRIRFHDKRLVVYMPTHRKQGESNMCLDKILDLDDLDRCLKEHDAVLLIKKHYYHSGEPEIHGYRNIFEITNEKSVSQILIDAADILITDYSSCYIDHLLLNRPQIFFCYDLLDYLSSDRDTYVPYIPNVPGAVCETSDELSEELDRLLRGDDRFLEKRKKMLNYYYSAENQGPVAERQLNAILDL